MLCIWEIKSLGLTNHQYFSEEKSQIIRNYCRLWETCPPNIDLKELQMWANPDSIQKNKRLCLSRMHGFCRGEDMKPKAWNLLVHQSRSLLAYLLQLSASRRGGEDTYRPTCELENGRIWLCMRAQLPQSYLTLCHPMDCSLPGSSVHGILQARLLEWVATPSSRRSSQLRDRTYISGIAGGFFTTEPPGKPRSSCIQP